MIQKMPMPCLTRLSGSMQDSEYAQRAATARGILEIYSFPAMGRKGNSWILNLYSREGITTFFSVFISLYAQIMS